MFTGFKLFYKMTIGIIQNVHLKSCCNSHQATFNFNNLPSHEKLFRLSVPRTLVMAGCQSKSKETPVAAPANTS
jgi:hypothetical protein